MQKSVFEVATEAVEVLQVKDFIEKNKKIVREKLEEREARVVEQENAGSDHQSTGNATFIAESLALMSGIIVVGSSKKNYYHAKGWVKTHYGEDSEPMPVFLALILIYIVNKTLEEAKSSGNEEEKTKWERISNRLNEFAPQKPIIKKEEKNGK